MTTAQQYESRRKECEQAVADAIYRGHAANSFPDLPPKEWDKIIAQLYAVQEMLRALPHPN